MVHWNPGCYVIDPISYPCSLVIWLCSVLGDFLYETLVSSALFFVRQPSLHQLHAVEGFPGTSTFPVILATSCTLLLHGHLLCTGTATTTFSGTHDAENQNDLSLQDGGLLPTRNWVRVPRPTMLGYQMTQASLQRFAQRSYGGGAFQAVDKLNGEQICGCSDISQCKANSTYGVCPKSSSSTETNTNGSPASTSPATSAAVSTEFNNPTIKLLLRLSATIVLIILILLEEV